MKNEVRDWAGTADTAAMQRLSSRCWPNGLHPGGLGWSQATHQLAATVVLIDGIRGEVDGWAGLTQPGSLTLQADPDRPDVLRALTQWLLATARGQGLTATVYDDQSRQAFIRAGFEPSAAPDGFYGMGDPGVRAIADLVADAPTPAGYTIRSVRTTETDARVVVHRESWRPADLPFHPDHQPTMDPSWTSSFDLNA